YFVTRIKDNTVYEVVKELELPEDEDQHVLLDEIIHLTGSKAKKINIHEIQFRQIVAYHEEENTTIEIFTNNVTFTN
ncbi:MAG: IS4 family transposase, partial [Bacteroidales bacterium]|nr:IS4 family transposase [Bacteroidales bacterium]